MNSKNLGEADWWAAIQLSGTPLVESIEDDDENCLLTFLWCDPEGNEHRSSISRVYIDINCVTDHHRADPQSLTRINDTNVWFWQLKIQQSWHGSYQLIPLREHQLVEPLPSKSAMPATSVKATIELQRQRWRSLLAFAIADPFNKQSPSHTMWGARYSAIHLAKAELADEWRDYDQEYDQEYDQQHDQRHDQQFDQQHDQQHARHHMTESTLVQFDNLQHINWHNAALNNSRRVWIFTPKLTGQKSIQPLQQRPLVILLDGEFWAESMPIFSVIQKLTEQAKLTESVYLLIESINPKLRSAELGCNEQFWNAIHHDLLPRVQKFCPHSTRAQDTIIAGQSFGGLSALYAGLNWPRKFARIISQSGSFWWPNVALMRPSLQSAVDSTAGETGVLIQQLERGDFSQQPVQVFLQAGTREKVINPLNQRIRQALEKNGHSVTFSEYDGGHDRLCWRAGLTNGLMHFLKPAGRNKPLNLRRQSNNQLNRELTSSSTKTSPVTTATN